MGLERDWAWSLIVVVLLATVPWTPLLAEPVNEPQLEGPPDEPQKTVHIDNRFAKGRRRYALR